MGKAYVHHAYVCMMSTAVDKMSREKGLAKSRAELRLILFRQLLCGIPHYI